MTLFKVTLKYHPVFDNCHLSSKIGFDFKNLRQTYKFLSVST